MSDAIGAELAQLAREIWAWQQATFGGLMTVEGALAKIRDECAEAIIAPSVGARREEFADVFFMLAQLVGITGGDPAAALDALFTGCDAVKSAMHCLFGETPARLLGVIVAESFSMAKGPCSHHRAGALAMPWTALCIVTGDIEHMPAAIRAKLEENRARTWAKPAADGTISHIKGQQ